MGDNSQNCESGAHCMPCLQLMGRKMSFPGWSGSLTLFKEGHLFWVYLSSPYCFYMLEKGTAWIVWPVLESSWGCYYFSDSSIRLSVVMSSCSLLLILTQARQIYLWSVNTARYLQLLPWGGDCFSFWHFPGMSSLWGSWCSLVHTWCFCCSGNIGDHCISTEAASL